MICSATLCNTLAMMEGEQDLDTPGGRLEWARERAGYHDAASFARAAKIHPTTYRAYEGNQNGFAKRAPDFARILGVPTDWLLKGGALPDGELPRDAVRQPSTDKAPPTSLADIASEHGLALIEEIDLPLGMGASFLQGHAEVMGIVPFRTDWLRGLHQGPIERLKVTRGSGDSMQPTIMDGDIVLVDTAHRRIDDQDRIWAVAYGDLGMIRRIRVTPRGSWLLMPDNQLVRPDEVGDGEVAVIGRVIWIGRRI